MKGREIGVDGKGLFRCLWCFLVILRFSIFGLKREMAHPIRFIVSESENFFFLDRKLFSRFL